eukprot:NODE_16187_length_1007_cov_12.373864.p2 GENE.NODE_16187_length_1007_cov_12.373864~~NODE_16187_length_1007_cov_12.373864.p2  ORF type:complete len:120 (-),score=5.82 NODE_16187_length_1007_cov_12.373864:72-431(-)
MCPSTCHTRTCKVMPGWLRKSRVVEISMLQDLPRKLLLEGGGIRRAVVPAERLHESRTASRGSVPQGMAGRLVEAAACRPCDVLRALASGSGERAGAAVARIDAVLARRFGGSKRPPFF